MTDLRQAIRRVRAATNTVMDRAEANFTIEGEQSETLGSCIEAVCAAAETTLPAPEYTLIVRFKGLPEQLTIDNCLSFAAVKARIAELPDILEILTITVRKFEPYVLNQDA